MRKTKVVFRSYPNGETIALFPEIPASSGTSRLCGSYQRPGQHAAADPDDVFAETTKASDEDAARLRAELEAYPYEYDLEVHSRITPAMHAEREWHWKQFRTP